MFIEVRRKDWAESFTHHVVTLGLLYYSWYVNFTRPGMMVMLLHDVSDIFLEAAKVGFPCSSAGAGGLGAGPGGLLSRRPVMGALAPAVAQPAARP
jgi:hypothetical protein